MGSHSVRVQFEGSDGERYTIKLEGRLSKDKVLRLMDMYELLAKEDGPDPIDEETVFGRIRSLVVDQFTLKRFTSDQVRDAFEDTYNQAIKLAEVSTYLTRMSNAGDVSRVKRGRKWVYRLSIPAEVPRRTRNENEQFARIVDR